MNESINLKWKMSRWIFRECLGDHFCDIGYDSILHQVSLVVELTYFIPPVIISHNAFQYKATQQFVSGADD